MSFRRALGVVKDQTSIGLAMVSSSLAPDLEVAIVKATSHEEEAARERHVREILAFTSYSRAYVCTCVEKLSRRLTKTRDWVVALKSLSLIHRLLSDGDPYFQLQILNATPRRGGRLLNLSDFRDEAHSNSWDLSAFVRSYALYLDQRLESALHESKLLANNRSQSQHERSVSIDTHSSFCHTPPPRHLRSSRSFDAETERERRRRPPPAIEITPARDLTTEALLSRMHHLQLLLDRFLACCPIGRAKSSRLVLLALHPVVRESFKIYADLCELLAALLDRFFEMEYPHCVKAFESYAGAGKQIDELVKFYSWCKDVAVARSSDFPEVQKITDQLLDTLEEFVREKAKDGGSKAPPPKQAEEPLSVPEEDIKALPPPPPPPPEEKKLEEQPPSEPAEETEIPAPVQTGDLVDLTEDAVSADDQGNKLALALFTGPGNGSIWNSSEVTSAWETPAAEAGKADWELALVESASNLAKQRTVLAGGLDPVLLDGMYDQGIVRQHVGHLQFTGGSASSVAPAILRPGSNPVLALPALDGSTVSVEKDPFAASLGVPPPSYVQMVDIEKKQKALVEEKAMWEQYARDGMQGQVGFAKISTGHNNYAIPAAVPYLPPVNGGGGGYFYP